MFLSKKQRKFLSATGPANSTVSEMQRNFCGNFKRSPITGCWGEAPTTKKLESFEQTIMDFGHGFAFPV
jgi:hypothetical protein